MRAPSEGATVSDLLRMGYSVERAEREATHVILPRRQYDALMAAPFWLLKLRSLGYVSAGHGRKIVDETLSIIRAAGIEIKADPARDEALRAAGLETEGE
jgi:hypothetical protein